MAGISIDANSWPSFILRWTFAGFWAALGYALCVRYLLPALPFV